MRRWARTKGSGRHPVPELVHQPGTPPGLTDGPAAGMARKSSWGCPSRAWPWNVETGAQKPRTKVFEGTADCQERQHPIGRRRCTTYGHPFTPEPGQDAEGDSLTTTLNGYSRMLFASFTTSSHLGSRRPISASTLDISTRGNREESSAEIGKDRKVPPRPLAVRSKPRRGASSRQGRGEVPHSEP